VGCRWMAGGRKRDLCWTLPATDEDKNASTVDAAPKSTSQVREGKKKMSGVRKGEWRALFIAESAAGWESTGRGVSCNIGEPEGSIPYRGEGGVGDT